MGNTHLEEKTKEELLSYAEANDIRTPSRAVDSLLAKADLLRVTEMLVNVLKTENERLKNTKIEQISE